MYQYTNRGKGIRFFTSQVLTAACSSCAAVCVTGELLRDSPQPSDLTPRSRNKEFWDDVQDGKAEQLSVNSRPSLCSLVQRVDVPNLDNSWTIPQFM